MELSATAPDAFAQAQALLVIARLNLRNAQRLYERMAVSEYVTDPEQIRAEHGVQACKEGIESINQFIGNA